MAERISKISSNLSAIKLLTKLKFCRQIQHKVPQQNKSCFLPATATTLLRYPDAGLSPSTKRRAIKFSQNDSRDKYSFDSHPVEACTCTPHLLLKQFSIASLSISMQYKKEPVSFVCASLVYRSGRERSERLYWLI